MQHPFHLNASQVCKDLSTRVQSRSGRAGGRRSILKTPLNGSSFLRILQKGWGCLSPASLIFKNLTRPRIAISFFPSFHFCSSILGFPFSLKYCPIRHLEIPKKPLDFILIRAILNAVDNYVSSAGVYSRFFFFQGLFPR